MTRAAGPLLSRVRLERLASAFELTTGEVLVDATTISDWRGYFSDLEPLLNARHGWSSDEAFHFVRHVRLEVWCTRNGIPDQPEPFIRAN